MASASIRGLGLSGVTAGGVYVAEHPERVAFAATRLGRAHDVEGRSARREGVVQSLAEQVGLGERNDV